LSALAHRVGDKMFEKMVTSIQSDEARHSQIGAPVLATLAVADPRTTAPVRRRATAMPG